MSLKILFVLRLFCCVLVLVSSVKSNKNEEDSGEENKNKMDKINEVLIELKSSIAENKLHGDQADVVHDQQIQQLLMEQNRSKERADELEVEINHINQILSELIEKPVICNRSLDEFYEHQKPDYTWVITDFHQKLNQTRFRMLSEVFPLRGYPFSAQANLEPFRRFLTIHLAFKKGNQSADSLPLKTLPAVAYTFKNHSDNHHHSDPIIRQEFELFNATLQYNTFSDGLWLISLESHQSQALNWVSKYRVSDTVSIDIYVEPPQWSRHACSHDGTLTWAINNYRKKLEMERDFRLYFQVSPYFYTSPNGYRVLVTIMLNGIEESRGKGATAFVWIVRGPNDKTLNQSFDFSSSVTFLHPTDPTKHITKSVDHRGILRMAPIEIDMGTHEDIELLLINDTLYYNVTVVVID